jgi:hypothetical protein
MKEKEIKKAADFLGLKVLTPLEENKVVGGTNIEDEVDGEAHHHTDEGRHHSHHDTTA